MTNGLSVKTKIDLNLLDAFIKRFPKLEFNNGVVLSPDRIVGLVNSGFKYKILTHRTIQYATEYLDQVLDILNEANIVEFELESVKGLPLQIKPIGGTLSLIIASFSTEGDDFEEDERMKGNENEDD